MSLFRHTLPLVCLISLALAQEPQKQQPPLPAVDVFNISAPKEEALTFTYPGKTISSQSVIIKARANGILQKKFFIEGEKLSLKAMKQRIPLQKPMLIRKTSIFKKLPKSGNVSNPSMTMALRVSKKKTLHFLPMKVLKPL